MELPKIVVDEKGYFRVKLPSGEMLPETEINIQNNVGDNDLCFVTVTFMAKHDLTNRCVIKGNNELRDTNTKI